MQAVKMRFKPLRNSSYDISIIIEREKRFRAIVGGNKGVYTPRLYPTTNKKPHKTPCNTVVYIRMYTTIASRLKGYTSHYKKQGKQAIELYSNCKIGTLQPSLYPNIENKIKQAETILTNNSGYLKVSGGITWNPVKAVYIPLLSLLSKIRTLLFLKKVSIHYCIVHLLDV